MAETTPALTFKRIAAPRVRGAQQSRAMRLLNDFLRRALDIFVSLLGLLLLSPVFGIVSLAIRRESPGPVFYRGKRAGLHGRPFGILKFRTMYEKPESHAGPAVTAGDDPRVTPLGHWLRKTKVNELPQLWNVLVGEMGLVGPRPEAYDIAMAWPPEVRAEILSARPGVTSPASVVYRDEESLLSGQNLMDAYLGDVLPSKLRLDLLYIRHRTVMSDLDVIFWTFIALLPHLRKTAIPESLLLWGPLSHFFSRVANWFFIDSLVAFAATAAAGIIWRFSEPLNLGWDLSLFLGLAIAFIFSLANMIFGLQNVAWSQAPSWEVLRLGFSTALSMGALSLFNELQPVDFLPTQMIVLAGGLAFSGFVATRYRERLLTGFASRWMRLRENQSLVAERVLLVGAGENSTLASWLLMRRAEFARLYRIVGIIDDDPRKFGMQIEGQRVIGNSRDLCRLVQDLDVGLIVYTIENISKDGEERILQACHQTSARVVVLPELLRFLRTQLNPEPVRSFAPQVERIAVPTVSALLWLKSLEQARQDRDWEEVDAQLAHIRTEFEHLSRDH